MAIIFLDDLNFNQLMISMKNALSYHDEYILSWLQHLHDFLFTSELEIDNWQKSGKIAALDLFIEF